METLMPFIGWINILISDICHLMAMVVIAIGVVKAFYIYLQDLRGARNSREKIMESRMELGHSFSVALAFLIGASILHTTLAPNWNDIGQLVAIIAIRTGLNFFLMKELQLVAKVGRCSSENDVASD